jgi:hypothetical protein
MPFLLLPVTSYHIIPNILYSILSYLSNLFHSSNYLAIYFQPLQHLTKLHH